MATLRYRGQTRFTAIGGIYMDRFNRDISVNMDGLHELAKPIIEAALESGELQLVEEVEAGLATTQDIQAIISKDMSSATKPVMSGIIEDDEKLVDVRTKMEW